MAEFLYERKGPLLTETEKKYYKAILSVIPKGYKVFPQINLAAFIKRTDGYRYQNELFRNVDFLITEENYVPVLVIEINDRTHETAKRQIRDKKVHDILEEAGIPMMALWTIYGINTDYIRGKIEEIINTNTERKHHFEETVKNNVDTNKYDDYFDRQPVQNYRPQMPQRPPIYPKKEKPKFKECKIMWLLIIAALIILYLLNRF